MYYFFTFEEFTSRKCKKDNADVLLFLLLKNLHREYEK